MMTHAEAEMEPPDFTLNTIADILVRQVGRDDRPVIVIEDLASDPFALVAWAGDGDGFREDPQDYYPGIRKPLPDAYSAALAALIGTTLRAPLGLDPGKSPRVLVSALSIVTRDPATLLPIQCVPHFDTAEDNQVAVVHYLCDAHCGGTSFYRHRGTEFETISADRHRAYTRALEREATTVGLPEARYINGDTGLFERIATVEARFNRAIFYPSNMLHAGDIDVSRGLFADPRRGRLTATSFVRLD